MRSIGENGLQTTRGVEYQLQVSHQTKKSDTDIGFSRQLKNIVESKSTTSVAVDKFLIDVSF